MDEFDPMQSAPAPTTPQERLIAATIQEIERTGGVSGVRVRAIAAAADANVAAVNYYFGSKQGLIDATLAATIEHFEYDVDQLLARYPAREALARIAEFCIVGSARYRAIVHAHLEPLITAKEPTGPFATYVHQLAQRIRPLIAAEADLDTEEAGLRAQALLSGMFFPALFSPLFDRLFDGGPPDAARTRAYVDTLVSAALSPAVPSPPSTRP